MRRLRHQVAGKPCSDVLTAKALLAGRIVEPWNDGTAGWLNAKSVGCQACRTPKWQNARSGKAPQVPPSQVSSNKWAELRGLKLGEPS